MKKNIFKKIFIKFSKLLGFEIIDQSEFNSPTLNKELNEELSNNLKQWELFSQNLEIAQERLRV